jgi:hypothetical protein
MWKKVVRDFVSEFDVKHTVKHVLLTTGLTVVGGPWGLAIGATYCVGDTVGEMKKFKDKDLKKFLLSLPEDTLKQLISKK